MEAWSVGIVIVSTGTLYLPWSLFHLAEPMMYRTMKASTSNPRRLPKTTPIHFKIMRIMLNDSPFYFNSHATYVANNLPVAPICRERDLCNQSSKSNSPGNRGRFPDYLGNFLGRWAR